MGGRWSIEARNLDDNLWQVCRYDLSFVMWIITSIKCLVKYEVVSIGKHG